MVGPLTLSLPALRQEIILHPAPPTADGAPGWTLVDPTRNRFFRINWMAFEILSRWHEGNAVHIVQRIADETTLHVSDADIEEVARFLASNHLLRITHPAQSRNLAKIAMAGKGRWLNWLLHHYLFFRIPLAQPDGFLGRTLPWVAPFFSPVFAWILVGLGALDVFLLFRQWDLFQATLIKHLGIAGFVSYGLTLLVVKSIHELGHAYTAKRAGCRVPTMGVAFLVLLPMLYTDTTEAWKLAHRKQRLVIAFGGVVAEGALAVLALLAWNVLPAGTTREMAFWIATTSLATTMIINLSPFMRFDGYFILSDWLDMPNLHQRAFQMARWWLREVLFASGVAVPEATSPAMRRFLVLFALSTWIYRLLLFLGIALLVYHFFIKVVGIILFLVEIGWFVLLPVGQEIKMWPAFYSKARSFWRLPLVLGVVLVALFWPWSVHVTAPAMVQGVAMVRIYAPEPARLERMRHPTFGAVAQGEEVFTLNSPDLERQKQLSRVRMGHSDWELAVGGLELEWARRSRVARSERDRSATTLAGLDATVNRLILLAPFAGELVDVPPDLTEGTWLRSGDHLATIVDRRQLAVEAYLGEDALGRIKAGARGRFVPDVAEYPGLTLFLDQTDPMGISQLDEPLLVSIYGGPIMVSTQKGIAVPEAALFRIRLRAETVTGWPPLRQRGVVHLEAKPQSLAERWTSAVLMVLVREWKM